MPKHMHNILLDLEDRFWSKVEKSDSCWLWTAGKNECGYGKFRWFGKSDRAHRVAWVLTNGEIPDNLCVLHKCDTPACVRPDHMFLGTRIENSADRTAKRRAPHGEQASWSKLTADQVRAIRTDPRPQSVIADEYGIIQQSVSLIKRRINWKHLPD